jgi:hypothetical protein
MNLRTLVMPILLLLLMPSLLLNNSFAGTHPPKFFWKQPYTDYRQLSNYYSSPLLACEAYSQQEYPPSGLANVIAVIEHPFSANSANRASCRYTQWNGQVTEFTTVDYRAICFTNNSFLPFTYNGICYDNCVAPAVFSNDTKTCVDPERYTITLSGGNTTEPWNKKHDPNHTAANLPYKAIVTDQNGQPKANIGVNITSDVTLDSGGHIHENSRPKGKLVPANISTKDGTASITGVTDSTGIFSLTFGAEEASGEHTLTAICTKCTAPAKATVNVSIPSLTLLGVDPANYDLQGYKDWHPGNHYFSEAAIVKIINLAHAYNQEFNQLLIINDSSLVNGGVFDLGQDWTYEYNGHAGHKKGLVVDINNYNAPSPRFEDMAANSFVQAQWHKKGTAPHYHLLLLGRDE